jgi:hypothetical protein
MPPEHPAAIPAAEATAATQALEALATELTACGWTAQVHTPQGRVPSLYVQNPGAPMLSEHIYAGSAADGTWSYWWSWACATRRCYSEWRWKTIHPLAVAAAG